jgi:hypothetical protein
VELNQQQQPTLAATSRATTDQAVQQTRALGDQIRETIRAQLEAQRAQRAQRALAAGQAVPTPPTPPAPPQTITIPAIEFGRNNDVPPEVVDISIAFFLTMAAIIIGLPLARAFARRMDRRGGAPQIPVQLTTQLDQLTQAVDAIALEVERISEGQRFTTRLLTEQREPQRQTLPSGQR